jgi:octaheme c-type cytochrome (tetrathionate reductase family)
MKAKFLAACHVALTALAAMLMLPVAVQAAQTGVSASADGGMVLSADHGGLTAADFIEYASINDEDIHQLYFSVILYEGTESCMMCHEQVAEEYLHTGHFKWQGKSENIVGFENGTYGKNQLLNNFCIAVPSNEGRCTQCHTGYGYADKNFDFNDPTKVDCLVCHDQSGTYKKNLTTAGLPMPGIDLNVVAQSISKGAEPTRLACIGCHASAGGGDNVKHGDLSTDLVSTTREYDVHMGVDGADMSCVDCHGVNHDPKDGAVNHGTAGMALHSIHEGEMKQCTDCHGSAVKNLHAGTSAEDLLAAGWHDRLACQVCHIPAIARKISTKVEWYWSEAGQDITPPIDPETGRPTYDKKKGSFVWKNDVRPVLAWYNGKWARKLIGVNDTYDAEPIELAVPQGSYDDPDAMIYPFKLMVGNQPVDPVNKVISVPHLFGGKGGPNPYWAKYDWNLALQDGAAYTGQPYSGTYAFANTEMLLTVNHEVAPAEQALGAGGRPESCLDCHTGGQYQWGRLGWTDDPLNGGERHQQGQGGPNQEVRLD